MIKLVIFLAALASCSIEPREPQECPDCVCECAPPPACPSPVCPPDDSMEGYLEGVSHGKKFTLDAIVLDLCFQHAGTSKGWQQRFDRCMRDFHSWEDHVRGG